MRERGRSWERGLFWVGFGWRSKGFFSNISVCFNLAFRRGLDSVVKVWGFVGLDRLWVGMEGDWMYLVCIVYDSP